MEENLLSTFTVSKLYDNIAVRIGAFLGGPLAAGYLMAENFKHFGQQDKVRNTWIISIITTFVVCVLAVLLSKIKNVPDYIVPVVYTSIASYLVQHYQGKEIKLHIEEGGQLYSRWRAALVGVIAFTIMLIILIAVFVIIQIFNG